MTAEPTNTRNVVRNRKESPKVVLGTGPLRSLGTLVFAIGLTIFCAEVFVMLLLQVLPEQSPHMEAVIDSILLIILLIVIVLFGATKLPKLGKGLGEGIRDFKKGFEKDEDSPDENESSSA